MNLLKTTVLGAMATASLAPLGAHAALILDTGTPNAAAAGAASLDGNDFSAAEFALGASQTITSIRAFATAGADQPGDTFTIALYSASDFGRFSQPVFSGQATYEQDGWTGLTNLDITGLAAGNYWAAVEVGSADSAIGLGLPAPATAGSAPALAYAFNAGSGYSTNGALPIGMQVEVAPVPIPGALLLFASGLLGLGGMSRRRS
jgi:hypothetical protein